MVFEVASDGSASLVSSSQPSAQNQPVPFDTVLVVLVVVMRTGSAVRILACESGCGREDMILCPLLDCGLLVCCWGQSLYYFGVIQKVFVCHELTYGLRVSYCRI